MTGIKVHLGNAGISLRDPARLACIQQLFALAQRRRAPVLVHMRARGGTSYGAEDARIFLRPPGFSRSRTTGPASHGSG